MARTSQNKWPEPYHWLKRHQLSRSSQFPQESSTQPPSQPRESSPHQFSAGSEGSTESRRNYQGKSRDENPVEDEYLTLNAELTPSTANEEPESSHPIRQRRKAAERDPWTASLERSGGVDYYGSRSSASAPSRPSHASVYHDAKEEPSQKQHSGPTVVQGSTKAGAKLSSKAGGSSKQWEKPALGDAHASEMDDYVFLM